MLSTRENHQPQTFEHLVVLFHPFYHLPAEAMLKCQSGLEAETEQCFHNATYNDTVFKDIKR